MYFAVTKEVGWEEPPDEKRGRDPSVAVKKRYRFVLDFSRRATKPKCTTEADRKPAPRECDSDCEECYDEEPAWHACFGCGEPRSDRYHDEHPIKRGRRPRPSLCGGCRHYRRKRLVKLAREGRRRRRDGEFEEGVDDREWCGRCGTLREGGGEMCGGCEGIAEKKRRERKSKGDGEIGMKSNGGEVCDQLRTTLKTPRSSPYALTPVSSRVEDVRAGAAASGTSTKSNGKTSATPTSSTKPDKKAADKRREKKATRPSVAQETIKKEKTKTTSSSVGYASDRGHSQTNSKKATIEGAKTEMAQPKRGASTERQESPALSQQEEEWVKLEEHFQQHGKYILQREKQSRLEMQAQQEQEHQQRNQNKQHQQQKQGNNPQNQHKKPSQAKKSKESKAQDKPADSPAPSTITIPPAATHPGDAAHTEAEEHHDRPHHRSVPSTASTIKPLHHRSSQPESKPTPSPQPCSQNFEEQCEPEVCSPEQEWQKGHSFSEEQEQVEEWYQRWQREQAQKAQERQQAQEHYHQYQQEYQHAQEWQQHTQQHYQAQEWQRQQAQHFPQYQQYHQACPQPHPQEPFPYQPLGMMNPGMGGAGISDMRWSSATGQTGTASPAMAGDEPFFFVPPTTGAYCDYTFTNEGSASASASDSASRCRSRSRSGSRSRSTPPTSTAASTPTPDCMPPSAADHHHAGNYGYGSPEMWERQQRVWEVDSEEEEEIEARRARRIRKGETRKGRREKREKDELCGSRVDLVAV